MLAYVEYAHTLDPLDWRARHERGEVPDALPYGLDRLAGEGVEVAVAARASARRSRVGRLAGRAARGVLRGLDAPLLLREREIRRSADVSLCWDERTGTTAALRSVGRGEPPVAMGVIWTTEPGRVRGAGLTRHALGAAGAVWALSSAQLDVLRAWGVARDRIHHLPMGIDAGFWSSSPGAQEEDLVLAVGNDRHRDHDALVEAVAEVRRRRPSVRLVLVTRSPVAVPPEVGVRLDACSHTELRALYARASVVALSVRHNLHVSGLTSLLETMASGRAVVATATPGMEDYVRDGETGVLVSVGSVALAHGLERLLADPERAFELGLNARKAVLERFTTAEQARRLATIVQTVLK